MPRKPEKATMEEGGKKKSTRESLSASGPRPPSESQAGSDILPGTGNQPEDSQTQSAPQLEGAQGRGEAKLTELTKPSQKSLPPAAPLIPSQCPRNLETSVADATGSASCATVLQGLATSCPHEYLAPLLTDSRRSTVEPPGRGQHKTIMCLDVSDQENKRKPECVSKLGSNWFSIACGRELADDCELCARPGSGGQSCKTDLRTANRNTGLHAAKGRQHCGTEGQKSLDKHASLDGNVISSVVSSQLPDTTSSKTEIMVAESTNYLEKQ